MDTDIREALARSMPDLALIDNPDLQQLAATGGLVSADPVIAALLAPLNRAMEALRDDDADRADRPPGPREAKVRT